MRALVLVAVMACAPKVSTRPLTFDEDLGNRPTATAPEPEDELTMERPVAPPGKGLRTGTISRDRLIAVLDAGPGAFLRQFEVTAKLTGERFVGWELVQLVGTDRAVRADTTHPLYDVDLMPGDVLLTVNGKPIARPDQLDALWKALRTSNEVVAELWRGKTKLTLAFSVEPKL